MNKHAFTRAVKFAREVSVIVLGVAIALIGQAIYEHGEESSRLSEAIHGLISDLGADLAFTAEIQRAHSIQHHAVTTLLHATDGRADDVAQESLAALVRESLLWPVGAKRSSSYDALVASGDLRLLGGPAPGDPRGPWLNRARSA